MSQRNPMNERYTTNKPQGVTRKSAASAKPVSKAASSVRTASSKPEKKGLFGGSSKGAGSSAKTAVKEAPAKEKTAKAKAAKAKAAKAKAAKAEPLSKEEQQAARKHNKDLEKQGKSAARQRNREINRFVPDTEEFKRLNRRRMILSGVGFAGMIVAIILSLVIPQLPAVSIGLMIVAWLFFFFGMRIDTKQLRPLREQGYNKAMRQAEKKARKKK